MVYLIFSAKAIYDNKLLECYFTRSFYKHILGILVKYTDMESEDYTFYQGLVYLMEHHVSDLGYDLTFSAEVSNLQKHYSYFNLVEVFIKFENTHMHFRAASVKPNHQV